MGQAEQLALAASELSNTASVYTNASGEIQRIMGLTSGVAYGLGGEASWQGQGYQEFVTAWKQVYGDGQGITDALTGAAGAMTKLAQTIHEQLPAIQKAEALASVNIDLLKPAALAQHEKDLASAQSASDAALSTIRSLANSLAGTLSGELATKVGVCNAGTGGTPPVSGDDPVTKAYAAGFWAGFMVAVTGGAGGGGGGTLPPAGPGSCGPENPGFWQEFLQALKVNLLTGKGLAWSISTGAIGGAMNTANNYRTSGLSPTTLNSFAGAGMGGTFGPISLTISQMLTRKIMQKCTFIPTQRENNIVTIINSFFGGVVIGGFVEPATLGKVLPKPKPTPAPSPAPAPSPTH